MDTNQSNNQQTNLFLQGMDTDISDMLLNNQKYRYAENVRITTNIDNNSGELRLIEGNKKINVSCNGNPVTGDVLALDSIRDLVVLINKVENSWNIYTINVDTGDATLIFGPCNERIWPIDWNRKDKTINTVLRWESDENIKLYITDNIHNIMSIQLTQKNQGSDFSKVFEYQTAPIKAPSVTISTGGGLKAAIVQYAYRLYKENGSATTISPMSEPKSLYRNQTKGYPQNKSTNKQAIVHIPEELNEVFDKIQLFRITYVQNGVDPTIELIADQPFVVQDILDLGVSCIEEVSVAEFLSYYNVFMTAELIESKGDYLFASNLKYLLDSVDDSFDKFDTRSYNLGAKTIINGLSVSILEIDGTYNLLNTNFPDKTQVITNDAFSDLNTISTYTEDYWRSISYNGKLYNGIGPYFGWRYIYKNNIKIYDTKDVAVVNASEDSCKSYRRGEIYRFGVLLYNNKGIHSSAKWIADIQIPNDYPITVNEEGEFFAKIVGIQFEPLHTDDPIWNNISGYEIVQCEKTINDRLSITLGIVGHVHNVNQMYWKDDNLVIKQEDYLTPIGFISLEDIDAVSLDYDHNETSSGTNIGCYRIASADPSEVSKIALPARNILQFASPEYVYQDDDIKDIIESKYSSLYLLEIVNYIPLSLACVSTENIQNSITLTLEDKDYPKLGGTTYFVKANSDYLPYDSYALGVFVPDSDTNQISCPTYVYNPATAIYNGAGEKKNYHDDDDGRYYTIGLINISGWRGISKINDENPTLLVPPYRTIKSTTYTQEPGGEQAGTLHFLNHMVPRSIYNLSIPNIEIEKAYYADSPQYSDFAKEGTLIFKNNSIAVSGKSFTNWTNPFIVTDDSTNYEFIKEHLKDDRNKIDAANYNEGGTSAITDYMYPTGSGGKTILFKTYEDIAINRNIRDTSIYKSMPMINIMDLRQKISPYGGYTESAIKNSKYVLIGGYQSGTNPVDIFAGDSFIQMFSYNASHEWYDPEMVRARKSATIYTVPVETYIDLRALYSDSLFAYTTTNNKIQDKPSSFNGYSQEDSAYLYNTAYNAVPNINTFVSDNRNRGLINNYDTRVHYSNLKTNNESIDNWTQFKALNFLDVDSRHGEITALLLFKDKLIFWLNNATGVLSVNERSVIQDDNSNALVIGTGGVLDRYDYITTTYGLKKNLYNLALSDTTLYWWDGNHKEILGMSDGIAPLTTTKSVKNYINTHEENSIPKIVYDTKYKEVICSVVGEESLVYSELILQFTSIYKYTPNYYCNVLGNTYTTSIDFGLYKEDDSANNEATLYNTKIYPYVRYVVNTNSGVNKVFDNQMFGGRFYKGDVKHIMFEYKTPLKQESNGSGNDLVTDIEYDFKMSIPRNMPRNESKNFGDRMRGKTMQCIIKSDSNDLDFSLQYVITKFRVSWT